MRSRLVKSCSIAIATLICCGASSSSCNTSNTNESIGPSGSEVAFAAVAVGAVVATAIIVPIEINKHHHNIQGCVFSTPNGLELRTTGDHVYALSGVTGNISPGTIVHLHGDPQRHDKHSAGDQVFLVKEIKKSTGPCTLLNTSAQSAPAPPNSVPASGEAHP